MTPRDTLEDVLEERGNIADTLDISEAALQAAEAFNAAQEAADACSCELDSAGE